MKKILYHGTTGDNAKDILENGFKNSSRVWNVSDVDNIYFYDLEKMIEVECLDADDIEYSEKCCISRAMENAQITAATQKYMKTDLVVLKIEIDSDYVSDDNSCQGMDSASQVSINNINSHGKIVGAFRGDCFVPSLAGVLFIQMLERDDCYVDDSYYSDVEINILRSLNINENYDITNAFLDMVDWDAMDI